MKRSDGSLVISPRLRAGLALKALLLVALAAAFGALALEALSRSAWGPLRFAAMLLFAAPSPFLGFAASLALADALLGRAVEEPGAVALASTRSGYSLPLPSGRFAEFLLFNPGPPLRAGVRYRVLIGRYSRVLVAAPVEEAGVAVRAPARSSTSGT
ncbi:MAG: hypothetical protein ACYC8T_19790 [Myxococcaceae bacterium]